MKSEKIELSDGYRLSSLAPWYYLRDKWAIAGDFSLPPLKDVKLYGKLKADAVQARAAGVVHSELELGR